MREDLSSKGLPEIVISDVDLERLSDLAVATEAKLPEIAEELLAELARAKVVERGAMPAGVVQMGSTVEYRSDDGQHRTVSLVFPAEADIEQGRISVMTPIGAALIGLAAGQSIAWTTRDGRRQQLTVVNVLAADDSPAA